MNGIIDARVIIQQKEREYAWMGRLIRHRVWRRTMGKKGMKREGEGNDVVKCEYC